MKAIKLTAAAIAAVAAFASCGEAASTETATAGETNDSTAVAAAEAAAIPAGAIVWFNYDEVINGYDCFNEKHAVLETEISDISNDLNNRGNKIQREYNDIVDKVNKGTMLRSVAEEQMNKWQEKYNSFQQLQQQKQQQMAEKEVTLINEINYAINQVVSAIREESGFAMVIETTPVPNNIEGAESVISQPVVAADPALNITSLIIERLNKEYIDAKNEAPAKAE